MGYEIKMMIGKSSVRGPEYEHDMSKPFSDGSGYENKRDEKGNLLPTGRELIWFQIMAEVDLCKLGYQDDSLNRLIQKSHDDAKADAKHSYYVYGLDGNMEFSEDRYGSKLSPVPVTDVLAAMNESHPTENSEYRRTKWAKSLLAAMVDDSEQLEVMFWGY